MLKEENISRHNIYSERQPEFAADYGLVKVQN